MTETPASCRESRGKDQFCVSHIKACLFNTFIRTVSSISLLLPSYMSRCRGLLCVKDFFWGGIGGDLNACTGKRCVCINQLTLMVLILEAITSNRADIAVDRRQVLAEELKHCNRLKKTLNRMTVLLVKQK